LTYVSKKIAIFSSNLYSDISSRLFKNYLYQDYNFYIFRNSSQLIQNATNEVNNLVNIFLVSFLGFLNEILILISIGLIFIYVHPQSFIFSVLIFSFFSIIFFFFIKKNIKKLSYEKQEHQISAIRCIQDGIRNIKDLKIYGLESKFYNYFLDESKKFAKIEQNVNFFSAIPRYYIELIGVLIFVGIFQLLFILNYSKSDTTIVLGVFAAAALKILPSINRILNASIKIKYSSLAIGVISKELSSNTKIIKKVSDKNLKIYGKLLLNNVSFQYKDNQSLFSKVNINIPLGKTIGIVGHSGSGKTTLVDLILGLLKPTKGKILLNNKDIFKNIRSWQNTIGYVQQFSYFIHGSIKNNIIVGSKSSFAENNRIYECIQVVGLKKLIETLPNKIDTRISELGNNFSGGQKQRLSIARAIYSNPEILVLDEATNSLDDEAEGVIIKNIIKFFKKKTIIIITHKKKLIKYCDIVLRVDNGSIRKI
jgi:ATP-binding cassette subfamily C protein